MTDRPANPHRASGAAARRADTAARQIRGSSLLLSGRGLSLGAKLATQLLMVRYLSTTDYGSWAYALSVVALLRGFAGLGLDRATARFASIYHQRGQYDRFFGIFLMATAAVLGTGIIFTTALYTSPETVTQWVGGEERPLSLLLIAIFLVPLEALDHLLITIFATFNRTRVIFFRQYVVTPVFQLSVVVLLILSQASVAFLAFGYVISTFLGVILYGGLLGRLLHQEGLLGSLVPRRVSLPFREIFSYTVPLMTSDWLAALVQSSGAVLLGYFHTTEQIATFRVVVPIAVLNQLMMQSFNFLYVPTASRLFADEDHAGIHDLYWRTALWIAVLSFPIFAVTFAAATPLTVLLFGARYEAAGVILAILAVGNYFQASLGFNGSTIKVYGKVRHIAGINVLAAVANVTLSLLLVPRFGAVGAAVAMSGTLVAHNLLKQVGLHLATGVAWAEASCLRSYVIIAGAVAALVAVRAMSPASPALLGGAAVATSLLVLALTRKTLGIADVFPEVGKIPMLRAIAT